MVTGSFELNTTLSSRRLIAILQCRSICFTCTAKSSKTHPSQNRCCSLSSSSCSTSRIILYTLWTTRRNVSKNQRDSTTALPVKTQTISSDN